ncbi:MAG TPA: serine/threonine-protein kinase [Pyrinomonadaceae bacterium]
MKKCPKCDKEFEDANTLCPSDGSVLKRQDELVGQTLAGKYRIEEKLSEGGMGCVYRATHVLMEKTLAVKVLHPALAADDNIVARFTREARAASRISHPHAITVTDFGEAENGVVFLVMEYLRGRTLKEVIRSEGPMPLKRAAEIVRQMAGALEAAHNEGVVHRDLKSDNIMLDETPGGDWAKVLDFGIAKIKETAENQDPELTAPNLIIGTPQYMSPEQCSGASKIDARSDIYSFGIIVYEMLAGHVPFTGDSPTEVMMMQMQEAAPSLHTERDDLPASVDAVVQRALAKNPDHRFQNAGELSGAFASAASADAPTEAAAAANAAARASATDGRGVPETSRIVVPTGENEAPRTTGAVASDEEEATVVSARTTRTREETREEYAPLPPPPAASFNPWRIAIPALIVLAAVFGLFYLFQGNDTAGETQPPLASDPNSQPVVSVTPPTGAGESNITPSTGLTTPTPGEVIAGETIPASGNANANLGVAPTPAGGDAGRNENANTEGEEEEAEPTPEPTPPERNTNRRAPTPPPPVNANPDPDEAPPPRKPAPTPPPPVSGDVPAPAGTSGVPPGRL